MNFKMKQAAAACALAFASTGAHAVTAFETPDLTVYLTGASAPQATLGSLASGLFQGTLGTDYFAYYDNGGTVGANYRAYFGQLKTTAQDPNMPAAIAGKKVLLVNRAKGGSVWGVNPVARAQGVGFMPVSAGNCTLNSATTSTTFQYICAESGNDLNPADPNNRVPDFGVSDVEPKMFKDSLNVEFGQTQLTDVEVANITNFGVSALLFGLPVTTNVSSVISSIPRAVFGGMLSGSINTWNKVSPLFAATDDVMVCRRVQGSGTQASYNQYFNNFPCGSNSLAGDGVVSTARMFDSAGFAAASLGLGDGSNTANAIGIDASSGYTVIENSSSGNVRTCLANARNGRDYYYRGDDGLTYLAKFGGTTLVAGRPVDQPLFTGGAQRKAIGILSLDSTPNVDWVFTSLNGVAPTKANLLDLSYDFNYELSMQYRTGSVDPLPAGDKKVFVDEFIKRSGDPVVLASLSTAAAVAAVPINFPVTTANVMKGTRFGNSCQPILPL